MIQTESVSDTQYLFYKISFLLLKWQAFQEKHSPFNES